MNTERQACEECGGWGEVMIEEGPHACYHCGMSGWEPDNCPQHEHSVKT